MTHEEAIPIIQGGITMRKKTRRFIGALLAMVIAFSSIGETVPAFAADELILNDENGEDTLLPDAESPEDVITDESGEDDSGIAGDVDTYLNEDAALDASFDNYADTVAGGEMMELLILMRIQPQPAIRRIRRMARSRTPSRITTI